MKDVGSSTSKRTRRPWENKKHKNRWQGERCARSLILREEKRLASGSGTKRKSLDNEKLETKQQHTQQWIILELLPAGHWGKHTCSFES